MSGVRKEGVKAFLEEAQGVERDLLQEKERKARQGWIFGWSQFTLAMMASVTAFYLATRPAPEPMVLRVSDTTGTVERVTTLSEDQVTATEADDKHWLNAFVLNRESYSYNSIQYSYRMTMLLSAPDVFKEYDAIYSGRNARDAVWLDNVERRVTIRSITPDIEKRTAVIRFSTQDLHKARGTKPEDPSYWIATIRYTYVAKAEMSEEDRLLNPKAFQVLAYRVDPEVVRQ